MKFLTLGANELQLKKGVCFDDYTLKRTDGKPSVKYNVCGLNLSLTNLSAKFIF